MRKYLILLSIFISLNNLYPENDILNEYIRLGLESNLALKQKNFSLEQSIQALKEARGMFFPSISIDARYSKAGGGRVIDFPVGDIINPMHTALNALLGQPGLFPANLENVRTPFLREKEHETKIRLIQPIFQPAIYYNYKIKSDLRKIEQMEKNIFSRQLIKDIKNAYFNYIQTHEVVKLFNETQKLMAENLRISEKLYQANMVTREVIFRAQAECSLIEQQKLTAENQKTLAQSYFNFLLNRSLTSEIIINDSLSAFKPSIFNYDSLLNAALNNREEIKQLKILTDITKKNTSITKTSFIPGINGVLDYGFQGEQYRFTEDDDFWMASLVLQWNLFKGFQDKARYEQSRLEEKKLTTKYEEFKKQIELQVKQVFDNFHIAQKSIDAAYQQLNSAKASFKIINKKYEQGMSAQIEFLDARNSLTNAEINLILKIYDYYIKCAEIERISATYPIMINNE